LGDCPLPFLTRGAAFTLSFKPRVHANPLKINGDGTSRHIASLLGTLHGFFNAFANAEGSIIGRIPEPDNPPCFFSSATLAPNPYTNLQAFTQGDLGGILQYG